MQLLNLPVTTFHFLGPVSQTKRRYDTRPYDLNVLNYHANIFSNATQIEVYGAKKYVPKGMVQDSVPGEVRGKGKMVEDESRSEAVWEGMVEPPTV